MPTSSSITFETFWLSEFIAVARVSMNPVLFCKRDVAREIAGDRRLDEVVDLALDRLLDRLVPPFDDRPGALAVLVDHGRGDQVELLAADRDVGLVAAGESVEHIALMRRALVERIHVGADQLAAVEPREHPAELRIGLAQHGLQGRVHVDDVVVVVGNHHIRPDHVETRAHPQVDDLLGD
jgi:hypothetical protein